MMSGRGIRLFSTTARRQDLFDFLRRKSIKPQQTSDATSKSTSEMMKKVESSPESQTSESQEAPVKQSLRVVGLPPKENVWQEQHNGFEMNAWPVRLVAPDLTEQQVAGTLRAKCEQILGSKAETGQNNGEESWKTASLEDLQLRFDFVKAVVNDLKVNVPDAVQSRIRTVGDIEEYYMQQVIGVRLNEKEPDALYLNEEDFGPNVKIVDAVEQKRTVKSKWNSVLKQAKAAEAAKEQEIMNKALE